MLSYFAFIWFIVLLNVLWGLGLYWIKLIPAEHKIRMSSVWTALKNLWCGGRFLLPGGLKSSPLLFYTLLHFISSDHRGLSPQHRSHCAEKPAGCCLLTRIKTPFLLIVRCDADICVYVWARVLCLFAQRCFFVVVGAILKLFTVDKSKYSRQI